MGSEISTGGLKTVVATAISGGNSSTNPILSGQTFDGFWEVTESFTSAVISVKTDQLGILYLESSIDGIVIDSSTSYVLEAGVEETHRFILNRKFFRVRILNASVVDQTYLRLQTIYGNFGTLSVPLNGTVAVDADAIITKSILYGKDSTGAIAPVASSDGLNAGGVYGVVNMPLANTAYEAKFGAAALPRRKSLLITVLTAGIYWGTDNSVTVATGTPLANGQQLSLTTDPEGSFKIFLVSNAINGQFKIVEMP